MRILTITFLMIFFSSLILLTGCVKDYDLNPYTTVMRFIVNEKK